MEYKKYKNKLRLLVIYTNNYNNKQYKKAKMIYEKNIKKFHKYYVKLLINVDKKNKFKIKLIGFDGKTKHTYNEMIPKNIFKDIEKMPMGHLRNPINLSLYEDYNKETTIKNLGFKDEEKAKYTIKRIKNKDMKYKKNVINTMYNRAKYHPYRTKEMEKAMAIFKKWLSANK
jgi:hypothetical protein